MQNITSVFVDSRFRTGASRSPTDFSYALQQNLQCDSDTVAHVNQLTFPNSFWTIEEDIRDKIALRLRNEDTKTTLCALVTLTPGYYDGHQFAEILPAILYEQSKLLAPDLQWEVQFIASEGRLGIQWGDGAVPARSWEILREAELASGVVPWESGTDGATVPGPQLNGPPGLIDEVINQYGLGVQTVFNDEIWISGFYDGRAGIHVAYLSSNVSPFNTVGPRPRTDNSVIARIPIEAGYGELVHFRDYSNPFNFVPVFNLSLLILDFRLHDHNGQTLNLHGGTTSFQLMLHNHPNT